MNARNLGGVVFLAAALLGFAWLFVHPPTDRFPYFAAAGVGILGALIIYPHEVKDAADIAGGLLRSRSDIEVTGSPDDAEQKYVYRDGKRTP